MEANDFIVRLKANGNENDLCNLQLVLEQYKSISSGLAAKDKGSFALNVLCIICRNLEKVPSWRDSIDGQMLVLLSIDCVRETRALARADQVKTLACIYHIHKHIVKLITPIPPELVLKLSYKPFDDSTLLEEYCKTYWNILADRITYIERLNAKHSVTKLLQRLTEDAIKVIQIYDSVQFCANILTFLIKKLHYIYHETNTNDLSKTFGGIFNGLLKKQDVSGFKKLKDKEVLDVYVKICDCIYVVAENASKTNFKESVLNNAVRTAITMLGHNADVMRCFETFFLNGFCSIFEDTSNVSNIENVMAHMLASCVTMEKSGQERVVNATYPFVNQLLRLYIEYSVANMKNSDTISFTDNIQNACLNLMLFLSSKKTDQQIKCDSCKVRSGFHDTLRLLFLIKHFPNTCITYNVDLKGMLPTFYKLVLMQHKILFELKKLGCSNHEKYFRKLQTDIHNTAISLNKATYYEYSIKLFNIYIEFELRYFKGGNELKNVSRALYNKSICELDCKLYNEALIDAFLSLIFSLPDGLNSEKHMSLVMDIKAKSLKHNEGSNDPLQNISVLEACKICLEERKYGNLKPFFENLNFSELLRHEFSMYSKLWPSIAPVGGVWRSLADLLKNNQPSWVKAESKETISWTLYEIVLETPMVVRTIHHEDFCSVVTELAAMLENDEQLPEVQFVQAAVLFLKCEFDLHEAGQKYSWKASEPTMDPDQAPSTRTIAQEYEATKSAVKAVHLLSDAMKHLKEVSKPRWLRNALRLYQVFVVQLLHLYKTLAALQLAHHCCGVAEHVGDSECYVTNASVIISHADKSRPQVMRLVSACTALWGEVSLQTALCFACDAAMYYHKCGSVGMAARLLRLVQAKLLEASKLSDVSLDFVVGRLCEAQYLVCGSTNSLSTVCGIQRHYLGITNTESKWCSRRYVWLWLKQAVCASGAVCTRTCARLRLWRRARCACAVSLPAAAAAAHAQLVALITNAHSFNDAQSKIDNRLKHILGLQPSNEPQLHLETPSKPKLFTPRNELETMLENVVFKKTHTSPSVPCTSVYAHKIPDFLHHRQCTCCLCDHVYSSMIACSASGLEASIYFRARELQIARNYFEGSLRILQLAETKLQSYFNAHKHHNDPWLVDIVKSRAFNDFHRVSLEVLIEATLFELSQELFDNADDLIVRMHEILQNAGNLDGYVKNEVYNAVIASARLRKGATLNLPGDLELEMENLRLSPRQDVEQPKTPELKPKAPPKLAKNIAKPEEVPNVKRKVIKLNLDDTEEREAAKPMRKRTEFKIPIPVTSKAVLENVTPRTRSKPAILVSKPSVEVQETPKRQTPEFFTPTSTPSDEFFTPMTSVKTYSKKCLRNNIVKNLESEFSTPIGDKEDSTLSTEAASSWMPSNTARATRSKIAKASLKRATSPGKLVKEKPTRSKVKTFSIHEDKK